MFPSLVLPPSNFLFFYLFATSATNNIKGINTGNDNDISPWSPAEWRINLNIGREPGTYMPEEWGRSGARLFLPIDILVESDHAKDILKHSEKDFVGEGNAMKLRTLEDPTFVSANGEEVVYLEEDGAWKINSRRSGKQGDASKLRFWIDLLSSDDEDDKDNIAARRNDVTIPAERLYFVANCWRENEFNIGIQRFNPIEATAKAAQNKLEQQLSHESGDRRLDGKNIVDTVTGSIDMATLVKKRDDAMYMLKEAEKVLPSRSLLTSSSNSIGQWPGSTERLIVAQGTIGVKRKSQNTLFSVDEYHIVGTFTMTQQTASSSD